MGDAAALDVEMAAAGAGGAATRALLGEYTTPARCALNYAVWLVVLQLCFWSACLSIGFSLSVCGELAGLRIAVRLLAAAVSIGAGLPRPCARHGLR